MTTFGQTLRELREGQGLSRRKLGYLIDRSEGAIRNWEEDADSPNRESLVALVKALGPEVLIAAFPDARIRVTARYLGRSGWPIPVQTPALALAGG